MSETPAGGESTVLGATGILGINNLQKAIDSFDRTVGVLQGIATKWSQGATGYAAGQKAGGSWNAASNWAGGTNGGNPTFNGTPFNPNASAGTSGGAGGAHAAAGPTAYASTGGGGGAHRGAGNGVGKAAFAFGIASTALSNLNAATTVPRDAANAQSMLYLTTANSMNTGQPGSASAAAKSTYGSGSWAYQGYQDQASATYSLWQNSGGPGMFSKMQKANQVQALASPMMSGSQNAAFTNSLYSVSGYIGLHQVGINTVGKGGSRQTPLQIANQILAQVDPNQTVTQPADIQRFITDPASNLRMTLGNWVAGGVITGDQVQPILDNIQTILKARSNNTGFSQLNTLMNSYQPGNASASTLKTMNIGNSAIQDAKSLDATKRNRTTSQLGGFETGLEQSTATLGKFNSALNDILNMTGVNEVMGVKHGLGSNGTVAGIMGGLSIATRALPGPIGSGIGAAGEIAKLAGGLFSGHFGGANDPGMSVNSQATNNTGSAGGSTTGSGPSVSGAGSAGAGGSTSSQKMTWPVNPHPLGTAFGVRGPMWALGYHTGQDFLVGVGTPVYAAASGTVVISGDGGSYGNEVVLSHGGGVYTRYAHNSRLVAGNGADVRQGQLISYSGATGNVTGPHLHFEVLQGSTDYHNAVNPLPYLGGSISVPGTTSGSGTPSTGSGSSSSLGSAAVYSGSGFTAGMSELDVLSSGGSGSFSGGTFSSGSGDGDGTSTGGSISSGGGGSAGQSANMAAVLAQAKKYGWGTGQEWNSLSQLVNSESGWNNTAQNPTSSAYGLFQFLNSTWASYGANKTSDPTAQAIAGMKYIKARYGDPDDAWSFHKAHNWYDKGAWEIKQDENARVHKGEMIWPKNEADQIREILATGNPYGAMGNKAASGGVTLDFQEGSIKIYLQSGDPQQARYLAKDLVDQVMLDNRIVNLQTGVISA